MAILKIARMGHPVLARPARTVDDPTAPEIRQLVLDMVDTMIDAPGVGLAAPQVHVDLRVLIFQVPTARAGRPDAEADDADGPQPLSVLINPEIDFLDGETSYDWEGCLSLPGLIGYVPRHNRIRYRATGIDGQPIERTAEGFHARVVQHEYDHLDGVLYPMRMDHLGKFGFVEEIRRTLAEEAEQGGNEEEKDD